MSLPDAEDYYWIMGCRERLVLVDEGRTAACTFFLMESEADVTRFWKRRPWTTPLDATHGTIAYIDRLDGHLTRGLLRQIRTVITERHPQVERAVYHRPARAGQAGDPCYTHPVERF